MRGVTTPNMATGMAFFVGGLAQFVADVCEFGTGNTFGMTVSCSYGGYWMAMGLLFWCVVRGAAGVSVVAFRQGDSRG